MTEVEGEGVDEAEVVAAGAAAPIRTEVSIPKETAFWTTSATDPNGEADEAEEGEGEGEEAEKEAEAECIDFRADFFMF
jgi:hypothetical protein